MPNPIAENKMIDSKNKTSFFMRWEFILIVLLVLILAFIAILTPDIFTLRNLLDATITFTEKSILALPMALLIISGVIDISVASISAMAGVLMGVFFKSGVDLGTAVVLGLLVGVAAGFFNGVVITKLKIPSIVVTLATMLIYRGVGYILLGDNAVRNLPESFGVLGGAYGNLFIPIQAIIFFVFTVIFGIILQLSSFGRKIYIIGNNEHAALYSGLHVDRIRIILTTVTGFVAALSGILLTSRIGSARPDIANGNEMMVITIVLLGGVSIYGGKGTIPGVFLSCLILGYIHYGLVLLRIQEQVIRIATGGLLIIALLIPTVVEKIRSLRKIQYE